MSDEMKTTSDLEIEMAKVLEEASKYSAASKEYTESIKNWSVLENARLNRERAEFERKRATEQMRIEKNKSAYDHEEKIARCKNDRVGHFVDFAKCAAGLLTTIGTTAIILNYEELKNLTSKALAFIPKPRLF